jgi:hypothetical protein
MSKDTVSDWAIIADDNTDVGGISLAENVMLPSAVNNALREIMKQVATGIDNSEFGTATASTTEVLTGTNATKAVTPDALAALWEKGANIASAGTISVGEGGFFHVTGTTGITDIDFATATNGRGVWIEFDGILTITHNATTMNLPGGANITTAAGDRMLAVQDSGDNVHVLVYQRADGTPIVTVPVTKGGTGLATLTANNVILGNGTSTPNFVAPGTSGNVLTSDGTTWNSSASAGGSTLLTEQATTSGTTKDFTIPAGAKRIFVMLNGVSMSTAVQIGIQLGDSGGVETSGYSARYTGPTAGTASTLFPCSSGSSSGETLTGTVTITRVNTTHTWIASAVLAQDTATNGVITMGGSKTTSAELTTVRLMGGTFDAGSVNVLYE